MDRSRRVFAPVNATFQQAFPTVEEVFVTYTEFEFVTAKGEGIVNVRRDGGLGRCGNPRCYRGGYEFDGEIHRMVRDHVTERKITMSCQGDEGTAKRKLGRRCAFSIQGTITVKYKT